MNARRLILPLGLLIGLSACDKLPWGGPAQTANADGAAQQTLALNDVALVNGQPITQETYDLYLESRKQQRPHERTPNRKDVVGELVDLELLSQQAIKSGLYKRPEVTARIQFQRDNILAGAMLEQVLQQANVSDAQIQQEYERLYLHQPLKEYKTRNILVAQKDEAEQVIRQLQQGADFAAVAHQKSIGPAKDNGGALEWFKPDDVLAPFADAVAKLKKGEFTRQPVKTAYGWHVILLEDVRDVAAPPFDEVKDKLRARLLRAHADRYLQKLRATAKIETR